jgi:N-acetylneuraminic acid mutarotase
MSRVFGRMRIVKWLLAAVAALVLLFAAGLVVLSLLPDRRLAALGYEVANERLVTGMLVTGTPAHPVLYVTSSDPRIGAGLWKDDLGLDTNSGIVSRLEWTGSNWQKVDLVRGLPRSEENHATNGLALDPATSTLYIAQGANTNEGAPSDHLGFLPEYALSGAILAIDLKRIGGRTYDLPTLDDETRDGRDDENDPFGGNDGRNQAKLVPGGPVRVFAPGYRNPYDIVLTRTGRLYSSQNGGAEEWGDVPAGEGPTGRCSNETREPGHYDPDTLHLVRPGEFAGHPNPTRGNRRNTFNSNHQSPVAQADPIQCDYVPARERKAVTSFVTSTNGLAEYTASNFGGVMRGNLLAASFDTEVHRIVLNAAGDGAVSNSGLFKLIAPLDVTAQDDRGPFPGTIWVTQYTEYLTKAEGEPDLVVFEPADYPGSSRWRSLAPSGLSRQETSFVRVGRRFYLAGGATAHQVYDPTKDSWRTVAPLPRNLDHIQGVALDGRIYYVGGLAAWPKPHVGSVYIYDPETDRFSSARPMARGRGAGGVAAYRGKIYYAGGLHDGRAVSWFDVYDPKRNSWSRLPDMPRARDHFHAAVVGGRLYAIGGRDTMLGKEIAATDAFDFATGKWVTGLAPIPTTRGGFAAAVVGREILVIGGEDKHRAHAEVEAYDPRRDRWRSLDPMPTARHGTQAVVCDGAVYVATGGAAPEGDHPTDVLESYTPPGSRGCGPKRPAKRGAKQPSFRRRALEGTSSYNPTAIQFGPDGRLYVAQQSGTIKVYSVDRRDGLYRVMSTETIDDVRWIPNHDDDGGSISDVESLLGVIGERLGL